MRIGMSRRGIVIATAAASLILAGAIAAREQEKAGERLVHCAGINECKGKGVCAGPESECAGVNTCKGKGVIAATPAECKEKGGKIVD
jgi:hypothetical protein